MDFIIYTPHPSLDEVYVIQRCEWSQISGGFLLVDQKKEKAFHMIYHEVDSDSPETSSASTDLYLMIVVHGCQVKVCALLYILEIIICGI